MTTRNTRGPQRPEQENSADEPPSYDDDPAVIDAWRHRLARKIRAMICGPANQCRQPRCRRSGLCALRIAVFGVDEQAKQPLPKPAGRPRGQGN